RAWGVCLIPGQQDFWNAKSRYAPIAIAQKAAQSAEAIFVLSIINGLDLASTYRSYLILATGYLTNSISPGRHCFVKKGFERTIESQNRRREQCSFPTTCSRHKSTRHAIRA